MVGWPLPVRAARLARGRTRTAAQGAGAPGLSHRIGNFVLFQLAWLAAVSGAAHGHVLAGCLVVVAVLACHLALAARPAREALLLLVAGLIGWAVESLQLRLGFIRYAGLAEGALWPPPWILLLWALLASTLNLSMRWLHGRPLLAALLAAVCGPAAFAGGARLGAATFIDMPAALGCMALAWALLMPMLLALAERLDGVAPHD